MVRRDAKRHPLRRRGTGQRAQEVYDKQGRAGAGGYYYYYYYCCCYYCYYY